jgi:hypothetical protein
MGSKIKPRQQKLPRSFSKEMGSNKKSVLAREQREKRAANPNKKNWSDSF